MILNIFRWYCHFDDDEYVNIPVLMRTLHVHEDKLYLGYWPSNSRWWRGRKVKVRRTVFDLLDLSNYACRLDSGDKTYKFDP